MYYVSRTQFPFFPLVREKYKTLERIPLLLFRYFLTLPRKFRDNYVVFPFVSFSRNLSNRFPEGSSRRQRRWQTGAVQPNHQHSPHRSWSTQQTELLQNLIMKYLLQIDAACVRGTKIIISPQKKPVLSQKKETEERHSPEMWSKKQLNLNLKKKLQPRSRRGKFK